MLELILNRKYRDKMYKQIIVGIDQSYQMTGICVLADQEVRLLRGLDLSKEKNNSDKRELVRQTLTQLFTNLSKKSENIVIYIERIRLQSAGFVNIDYIKSIGALNALIVDVANVLNIEVYSVDTRSWKARVIGTVDAKKNDFGVDPKKWPTVQYVINKGYEKELLIEITTRKRKETFVRDDKRWMYNSDIADAFGIAHYFYKGEKSLLQLEK